MVVEQIPPALRSDTALRRHFEALFPGGQVHSALVHMELPELEDLLRLRYDVLGRLERALLRKAALERRHAPGRPAAEPMHRAWMPAGGPCVTNTSTGPSLRKARWFASSAAST